MNAAVQNNNIFVLNRDRQERLSSCQACSKKAVCPAAARADADGAGQSQQRVIKAGKTAFEAGDRFEGIYIVRSGFFKSYSIDADGVMQVTGFHLPGEFFGMDGLEGGTHREYVEALDTSSVCRIPVEALGGELRADGAHSAWQGHLMLALVKLMSRTISRDHEMFFTLGKMPARRRLGAFLADLSRRMAQGGYSATEFRLCMSRTDIANYLCLALETVSRLFTQMQLDGTLEVERRDLRIRDMQALVQDEAAAPSQPRLRQHASR